MRIVRGYRTISYEAATVLARYPPFDILAEMDAWVYDQIRTVSEDAESDMSNRTTVMRRSAHRQAFEKWREKLETQGCSSQRAVGAVMPSFEAWMERKGCITYRLTQILTGHGCFGEYLNRIGREVTAQCHHCPCDRDSAQHTLEDCPAWQSIRADLVAQVGQDLSPPSLITAMLKSEDNWMAAVSFCESVMLQKESAERDRERADPARRRRRRGRGRGQRQTSLVGRARTQLGEL